MRSRNDHIRTALRLGALACTAGLYLYRPAQVVARPVDPFVDLSFGKSCPRDSDLVIQQRDLGTDLKIRKVPFDDDSFVGPIWYRVRAGGFFRRPSWLGFAIELVHPKIYARTSAVRRIVGTHRGAVVDSSAPIDQVVQRFGISHGINHLALEGLIRRSLAGRSQRFPAGRLQLFGGLGAGPVIAHPENEVDGVPNRERFEIAGLGIQGFAGVRGLLHPGLGLACEYKFTRSDPEVHLASGTARINERTHHFSLGLTIAP